MIKKRRKNVEKYGNEESFLTMLASEAVLAKDWLNEKDEEAWKDL